MLTAFFSRFESLLTVFLVVSITLNVFLELRLKQIETTLSSIRGSRELQSGVALPPLDVLNRTGERVVIPFGPQPLLIYVLSPRCPWCRRNFTNIKSLAQATEGRYLVVGLSVAQGSPAPGDFSGYPFPVYSDPSAAVLASYKLGGTPQTIVVSTDGRVLQSWKGAYEGEVSDSIEHFFSVKLPGLLNARGE